MKGRAVYSVLSHFSACYDLQVAQGLLEFRNGSVLLLIFLKDK